MLGNGLKRRKLCDDDDDDGGGGRGDEEQGQTALSRQRQTVLNVSLVKLYQKPHALCLQRRVLIGNVVRRIHDDVRREGGGALFFNVSSNYTSSDSAPSKDQSHGQNSNSNSSSFNIMSSPFSGLDSCLTPAASLLEEDVFFAMPPPPSGSSASSSSVAILKQTTPKDSFSSALAEIEELCPSSNSTFADLSIQTRVQFDVAMDEKDNDEKQEKGRDFKEVEIKPEPPFSPDLSLPQLKTFPHIHPLPLPNGVQFDVEMKEEDVELNEDKDQNFQEVQKKSDPPFPQFPPPKSSPLVPIVPVPPNASVFLTDFTLDDVLFTDIDTSMYDYGPSSAVANPTQQPSKQQQLVVVAGGNGQNQTFNKLELNELDHIMEVLVGS